MKKTTHKEINRIGEMLDGIKLACNIYTFENAEHYISILKNFDENTGVCCEKVNEIITELKKLAQVLKGAGLIISYTQPVYMVVLADFQKSPC